MEKENRVVDGARRLALAPIKAVGKFAWWLTLLAVVPTCFAMLFLEWVGVYDSVLHRFVYAWERVDAKVKRLLEI